MANDRTVASGSHEAQALVRRGMQPVAEFNGELVLAVPSEDVPEPAGAGLLMARHHQRRYFRYMRYAFVAAILSLMGLFWYVSKNQECVYNGLCYDYGWSSLDTLGAVCAALILLGGAMLLAANRHGHRANELERAMAESDPTRDDDLKPFRWPED
jgi:hypothetical protein